MHSKSLLAALAAASLALAVDAIAQGSVSPVAGAEVMKPGTTHRPHAQARNVIFFVGDGMGVSTVTAARIFSVGIDGKLEIDQFPFTSLSRTYTTDYITPDSAGTMTAMMTGVNTNSGIISMDEKTERLDFNKDGDGKSLPTLLELAKAKGMKVGVVSTARVTHATPACCYSHVNDRDREAEIASQATPGDPLYNKALGGGLDLLAGGGRRFFMPNTTIDEEGDRGSRTDDRDLRDEWQDQGYSYVWNRNAWNKLTASDLPVLGLFESSHMEYEYDRILDVGGEPSLVELTTKSIDMLSKAAAGNGYFLMIESGRIDHAHHAGNAWRCMVETEEFDEAIGAALRQVDLRDTLIVVTADHSHVFNIAGYPMRKPTELPYKVTETPMTWIKGTHGGLFNIVFDLDRSSGKVFAAGDADGVPYTTLVYGNGPGYRKGPRTDPLADAFKGLGGSSVGGPNDPNYLQEAAVPMGSETHSAEDVAIYAIGAGSSLNMGTVKNTHNFVLMKTALGL